MSIVFFQGLMVGASLIVAIGAQNVFVLSRGIRKHHHLLVAFICSLCDTALIFAGTLSTGQLVADNPGLRTVASWGGALFLFVYGSRALYCALRTKEVFKDDGQILGSLKSTIGVTLAVTLLNPHVYIDTVLLLGSIAGQHGVHGKYVFALGASVFSWLWFFGLSLGGGKLANLFKQSISWRILDGIVWLTMWSIAWMLVKNVYVG